MADRRWGVDDLQAVGARSGVVAGARHLWAPPEQGLRRSGERFDTWQYDMRKAGIMAAGWAPK